nr:3'(2'),5'-bisphosphate nucleotidase CysQ [uncultured Campylobacter sp.]
MQKLLNLAKLVATKAGDEIMKFYAHKGFDDEILAARSTLSESAFSQNCRDFEVNLKTDHSPVTSADLAANAAIFETLKSSNLPICSEEKILVESARTFWLIDPLDGTKDFIEGSGEFCVCIALIEDGRPVLGVIYVPVTGEIYSAAKGERTQKELYKNGAFIPQTLAAKEHAPQTIISGKRGKNVAAGKLASALNLGIARLSSAIKYCRIAENLAGAYMRYSPSSIWDNAAGEMIAACAGAKMIDLATLKAPIYDAASLKNNEFIVIAKDFLAREDEILRAIKGLNL